MAAESEFEALSYICKLLRDNLRLPVRLVVGDPGETGEAATFDSVEDGLKHPLDPDGRAVRSGVLSDASPLGMPCIGSWNGFEQYVWLRFGDKTGPTGAGAGAGAIVIVIGPAAVATVTDETIEGFLFDRRISSVCLGPLRDYYRQLPVRSRKSMLHAATLLAYLIERKPFDITEVIDRGGPVSTHAALYDEVEKNLADRRQSLRFHHHPDAEKLLMQYVKEGRKTEIARSFELVPRENLGVLSRKSRLRNEKNMAICLVTLATRAAIDGGLYPETAYTASDLWIQHIEELKDVDAVIRAGQEILYDFAERVASQRLSRRSKPVAVCQNYIFNHIYEPIGLSELARAAGVHPAYLSKLFKQELGMTVTEYIQRQKVEEAKKLLALSDATPLRAANLLNFYDQSHFTKVFKKYTGVTPKQYKDRDARS